MSLGASALKVEGPIEQKGSTKGEYCLGSNHGNQHCVTWFGAMPIEGSVIEPYQHTYRSKESEMYGTR